jgi:hypothetical protein
MTARSVGPDQAGNGASNQTAAASSIDAAVSDQINLERIGIHITSKP